MAVKEYSPRTIKGKVVEDAVRRVKLNIQPTDIKDADPKQPGSCAAARAAVRQMHAISALVGVSRTFVEYFDCWKRYMTPKSLRTEIVALDRGGRMQAGVHVLTPPPPSQGEAVRSANNREYNKTAKDKVKSGKKKRTQYKIMDVRHLHPYDKAHS